ncbi:ATP-dependent DNA helicase [Bifidobacterium sp. AGR2158]|uniref:ATP-dependent DNA helicase n=1 Tax=Bifidobacterium sp. AGR2158 TaxID=1280675 RepID=UPI0006879537|nr:ATP-dependent DNA helicase [Bifidobacterium sp. AGR2158]
MDTQHTPMDEPRQPQRKPKKPRKTTPSLQQRKIIDAPKDDDLLVVAGAGSGKTFTMTERIIRLIEDGVPPEHILGLTFTKKAASELLTRVSAAVDVRARTSMFMKPDVYTYDAFFQSIVRQYGLLVGFDQQTQPLSEAGARQLIATTVGEHMDVVRDSGVEFTRFTDIVDAVFALSSNIASSMIGGDCDGVDGAIARIRAWDRAFLELIDGMGVDFDAVDDEAPSVPDLSPKSQRLSKYQYDRRVKANGEPYAQAMRTNEKIDYWRDHIQQFHIKQMREATVRRELLLTLVQLYTDAKRRNHMAEFSDFTVAAHQLVTRFPSIGERYRARYTHVLLDEYQDTSTTQAMLLAKLFCGPDGKSAVSAVGDPFQSIYAWRGASPGAFRLFQRSFGLPDDYEPYALSETRRNAVVVLEAANNLTAALRDQAHDGSSVRVHEVDVRTLSIPRDGNTEVHEGTLGVLGYATRGQEIDGVVRFAKHAIAKHEREDAERVAQGEDPQGTKPHVAVLFRGKAQIPAFQAALEEAGLTTFAVGTSSLLEQPEVLDVLALMHVVADRSDAASLMRLLATPRFGLGAADLRRLARMADERNVDYRYRALIEAGVIGVDKVDGDDAAARRRTVREHAREVPNAVFAADLLMDDNADETIEGSHISEAGKRALHHAGAVLRRVRQVAYGPIEEVMRAAVDALDLDIDMLVADAERRRHGMGRETPANTAATRASIDALLCTVRTYVQEIATMQTPTLRGYLSWIDAQRSVDEGAAPMPDAPVDVILMTVHQSKGLEWDAVAVVGLQRNKFPSNQGERLKVEYDDRPGVEKSFDPLDMLGAWTPPDYKAQAHTWVTDPAAVPVPVRSDAAILPAFPGDARRIAGSNDYDPIAALGADDEVGLLDDDVFGSLREYNIVNDDGFPHNADALWGDAELWTMPQTEEFGRRLYADERRLMYVALTRARDEALLTYSEDASTVRMADASASPRTAAAAHAVACAAGYAAWDDPEEREVVVPNDSSMFWREVHDSLLLDPSTHVAAVEAAREGGTGDEAAALDARWTRSMHRPALIARYNMARAADEQAAQAKRTLEQAHEDGLPKEELEALEERALELEQRAYECAFALADDEIDDDAPTAWTLDEIGEARPAGYFVGEHARDFADVVVGDAWNTPIEERADAVSRPWPFALSDGLAERLRVGVEGIGRKMEDWERSGKAEPAPDNVRAGSLVAHALALISDPSFGALPDMPSDQLLALLKDKARRALRAQRMNATALQRGADLGRAAAADGEAVGGDIGERERRRRAERDLDLVAGVLRPIPAMSSPQAADGTRLHAWAERFVRAGLNDDGAARARMIADVERALADGEAADADARRFALWQHRLIDSPWASRVPEAAEEAIVVAIDGVDNLVQGKLDAVFIGGLDPHDDTKRFTVVDWKTGHRPRKSEDIEEKLRQLDFYRLMLAKARGVPLETVDGALYYVSEEDADARQIDAEPKDEATIIREIRAGIAFDDDGGEDGDKAAAARG